MQSELQRICTRASIIREGRIIACDTVEALAQTGARRVTVHGSFPMEGLTGVRGMQTVDGGISFLYSGDMNELVGRMAQGKIAGLTVTEPDLEEIFLHYYEKGGEAK